MKPVAERTLVEAVEIYTEEPVRFMSPWAMAAVVEARAQKATDFIEEIEVLSAT